MASAIKTYFLVSGWDFPVGSITLGSIIDSPSIPQPTLFSCEPSIIDTPIFPTSKSNFSTTIRTSRRGHFGLFAKFLQIFGVGGEASVKFHHSRIEKYSFKHMETNWFIPSRAFIKKAAESADVVNFLKQTDYADPVYMITGIKTVEGASITTSGKRGYDIPRLIFS